MVVVVGYIICQLAVGKMPLPVFTGETAFGSVVEFPGVGGLIQIKVRRGSGHMLFYLCLCLIEMGPTLHIADKTADNPAAMLIKPVRVTDHRPPDLLHLLPADLGPLAVIQHPCSRIEHGCQHRHNTDNDDHFQEGYALLVCWEHFLPLRFDFYF